MRGTWLRAYTIQTNKKYMAQDFHSRLRKYYREVAKVLVGQADAASIFPNPTDKGSSREEIYAEFLRQHAPAKCSVLLGGFLFHEDGRESKQLDVIVIGDTAPRFSLFKKSFAPVEGALCAVSIKSMLDTKALEDALKGIASIPPTTPLGKRLSPMFQVADYEDWPIKVVYSSRGISPQSLHDSLTAFYEKNSDIPIARRPHFIHIGGSCLLARVTREFHVLDAGTGKPMPIGAYFRVEGEHCDAGAVAWLLYELQKVASVSSQIMFRYDQLIDKVMGGF